MALSSYPETCLRLRKAGIKGMHCHTQPNVNLYLVSDLTFFYLAHTNKITLGFCFFPYFVAGAIKR